MNMEATAPRALSNLSFILLASGFCMAAPYLAIAGTRLIGAGMSSFHPEGFLSILLIVGQAVLLIPLVTIPLAAAWAYRDQDNRDREFSVVYKTALRFAPALLLEVVHVVLTIMYDALRVPFVFGLILMAYSIALMARDRKAAPAVS